MIAEASRPMIIVGNGARDDMASVIALADRLGTPVATTFKGKGLIGDDHELGCGVMGRSGTPIASWFMNESDLVIVFGASFANHTGIADYKPLIQVDYDPMALGRFHSVDVPLQGHVGVTAAQLLAAIPRRSNARSSRRDRGTLGDLASGERQAESRRRGSWHRRCCRHGQPWECNRP